MPVSTDIIVVGSGFAGLTVASLLTKDGRKVTILEQNWLPGGCSSSYPRKNYIFESGATTLVGLDQDMPVWYLLRETGLDVPVMKLDIPMQVHLADAKIATRYQGLEEWIAEAERVFGPKGQRAFWEYCYGISKQVWSVSLKQRRFPPSSFSDLWNAAMNFEWSQLKLPPLAFRSMKQLLAKYDLLDNQSFIDFVNEQLLITAQNYLEEVNVLFGATALCYTQYSNFYVEGGIIKLVEPLVDYLAENNSELRLREEVLEIKKNGKGYDVRSNKEVYHAPVVVSAIPINNTLSIWGDERLHKRFAPSKMDSEMLNSAFSFGLVFKKRKRFDCLHHQLHLEEPMPYTGSRSIFLSLSHPDDTLRCGPDEVVASVTTHVPDPQRTIIDSKEIIEECIINRLESAGILKADDIIFSHSSTPKAWKKWTGREWGFVGGYPQYMKIKPWQMLNARLDHHGAYICGDSTYPGQGIPGACLSGIIAFEKIRSDHR